MPWHSGSTFGEGPRRPMALGERKAYKLHLHARRRVKVLTPSDVTVGIALLDCLGADGRCDPSYDTLATNTGLNERTVRRSAANLRAAGMLRWERRIVREGADVRQTSNAYELVIPDKLPDASMDGQNVRGLPSRLISPSLKVSRSPVAARVVDEEAEAIASRDRQLAALGITPQPLPVGDPALLLRTRFARQVWQVPPPASPSARLTPQPIGAPTTSLRCGGRAAKDFAKTASDARAGIRVSTCTRQLGVG